MTHIYIKNVNHKEIQLSIDEKKASECAKLVAAILFFQNEAENIPS